ncbi:MAG TPA: glycogen-debranching protein [Deltaproteobacteria bacterium]|nr:glycogen-debranching protein [Deltaproteobacteria bacterium]
MLALSLILACRPELIGYVSTVPVAPPATTSTLAGPTAPAGPRVEGDLLVFRVPARHATRVEAWLYAEPQGADAVLRVVLEATSDRFVGAVSLAELDAAGLEVVWYGLRAWGPNWAYDPGWSPGSELGFLTDVDDLGNRYNPNKLLIDPWAHELSHDPGTDWGLFASGEHRARDSGPEAPKGLALLQPPAPPLEGPEIPLRDTVVYEVHLRGLTMQDPVVPEALRGTYAGAALRAPYLAELGVTAVELLPIQETSNDQNDLDPDTVYGDNYWGYSTLAYHAPDRRYAADQSPGGPTREVRDMVEAFHAEGIEVWIDVVYNHTAEGGTWDGGDTAPLLSWRGLDNAAYYELDGPSGYRNDNGVGPNLDATDPHVRELVLDSLRWWSEGLGIDGFRFDLAPILGNGCSKGCFSWEPGDPEGLLQRIDAELDAKVVAEPWAITEGTYQGGAFPGDWAEWNDGFRDRIRSDQNRLGVDDVTPGSLANAWSGSWDRFGDDGRQPWHSINFITAHDGMTLADLYSCNNKHNDQPWPYGPSDGGTDDDRAWDQGGDPVAQRHAARTGMALLLLSAGVPMFTGGDEFLRTQRCNNNPYNVDAPGIWLDWGWSEGGDPQAFTELTRSLLALRAAHPVLRPDTWRPDDQVSWLAPDGSVASSAYLDNPDNHALALRLDGAPAQDPAQALFIAYNGWTDGVTFTLPPAPSGQPWRIAVDTAPWLEGEHHAFAPGSEPTLPDDTYLLHGRSVVVLIDP